MMHLLSPVVRRLAEQKAISIKRVEICKTCSDSTVIGNSIVCNFCKCEMTIKARIPKMSCANPKNQLW
jgi:hypothetical protein